MLFGLLDQQEQSTSQAYDHTILFQSLSVQSFIVAPLLLQLSIGFRYKVFQLQPLLEMWNYYRTFIKSTILFKSVQLFVCIIINTIMSSRLNNKIITYN